MCVVAENEKNTKPDETGVAFSSDPDGWFLVDVGRVIGDAPEPSNQLSSFGYFDFQISVAVSLRSRF